MSEKKQIRIVSATTHEETGELEVILEIKTEQSPQDFPKTQLKSVWIDGETLLEMAD